MDLVLQGEYPAKEAYNEYGITGTFEAIAGDRVVIGVRRGTENILFLDETVPAGKKWTYIAGCRIFEHDV